MYFSTLIFCFLQKHILPCNNIIDIENTLNQRNMPYNNSIDKYQSISFCYTELVVLLSHEKELVVSVAVFNPFSTNVPLM